MKAKKPKLHVYVLSWFDGLGEDARSYYILRTLQGAVVDEHFTYELRSSTQLASKLLRHWFALYGQHSELRIRRRDGSFAPARTYPRSADPKWSKG